MCWRYPLKPVLLSLGAVHPLRKPGGLEDKQLQQSWPWQSQASCFTSRNFDPDTISGQNLRAHCRHNQIDEHMSVLLYRSQYKHYCFNSNWHKATVFMGCTLFFCHSYTHSIQVILPVDHTWNKFLKLTLILWVLSQNSVCTHHQLFGKQKQTLQGCSILQQE